MDLPGILIRNRLLSLYGLGFVTAVFALLTGCGNLQPSVSEIEQGTIPSTPTFPAIEQIDPSATAHLITVSTDTPLKIVSPSVTPEMTPSLTSTPVITMIPTSTMTAEATPSPTELPSPTSTATATAEPVLVNRVPQDTFIILPDPVRQNVREIFGRGQTLGRNPNAFSKLGDSVTLTDHFLTRFDSGHYTLGPYAHLQPAVDHYSGSFARFGVATRVGLHAWSIFDPLWANKDWCLPDEHMIACEVRLFNPSVVLIKIGSNDSGAASAFDSNVRQLVEYLSSNGIIPVLATKADRFEGPDDRNNKMLRQIATEYEIPLWDYDRVAETLPRRGLSGDDVHMTMADADDYTDPVTFERGYPMSDLTALMMLHAILQEVTIVSGS